MPQSQTYLEEIHSQIPALHLLINMGWHYLSPNEALHLRGGREKNVMLTGVLEPWLRAQNSITYQGRTYDFSDGNIQQAVDKLVNEPFQSLAVTNQSLYELLTLGTSLTQTIDGDRKSYSLHYIDWQHPQNNVYHVTDEYSVERRGTHKTSRPDIVLFVNGIPLVVIECKRSDQEYQGKSGVEEGISQMVRNQGEEYIPHLFVTSQLLLSITPNDVRYATTGTPFKFWSLWREDGLPAHELDLAAHALINNPLEPGVLERLYDWRKYAASIRQHFAQLGERLPTEQDRTLFALLRPQRLLKLAYQFIVYDNGTKKIARYQQYFAVEQTMRRVAHLNPQGERTGGIIWHTTGSGKSLTMVMLAKALALHPNIPNPKVILVTDRVNLDDQIYGTFHACGKSVVQAQNGRHLVRLVTGRVQRQEDRADVITTIINKFDEAARQKVKDAGVNTFVLVDESHRTQYGSMHARMRQVFPHACYIGFTGTPLTKQEKSTAERFGSFIHAYPMRQAVADRAVVPLLYEGRMVDQDVDQAQLERWFERTTRHLSDEQRADLKRKMSRSDVLNATEQRIKEIAYNVALHYEQSYRGTGFKAQLATASKEIGSKHLGYLREYGIEAALVISPPDTREGHESVDGPPPAVQQFWAQMMAQYGSEEAYNKGVLASFGRADGIEIMVVVDKLLTGFDEPRNRVLYIDKSLKEHTLLQAIARVNRLYEGKDHGLIVDYRGVLGELNEAINTYDALAEYDAEDVAGTLTDVSTEIARLPQVHSDLWALFGPVKNKRDAEQMERHLEPEDRRQRFYELLSDYARILKLALSSLNFYEEVGDDQIKRYKGDLKFFDGLRRAVKLRYAESVNYRDDYEAKVRKLLDEHIRATGTSILNEMVNIFDIDRFDEEVARLTTSKAKADTILHRMKRTISLHIDEDPTFYRSFSEMIEEALEAYRQGLLSEAELLEHARSLLADMRSGKASGEPDMLAAYPHAPAYFRSLKSQLDGRELPEEVLARTAIRLEEIVAEYRVTDWTSNGDVQKNVKRAIDHQLYDLDKQNNLGLTYAEMDRLIEDALGIAISREKAGR